MKDKQKKRYLYIALTIILIIGIALLIPVVNADSGFDSSYDGGGGYSGGSYGGSYGGGYSGDSIGVALDLFSIFFYLPPWLSIPLAIAFFITIVIVSIKIEKEAKNRQQKPLITTLLNHQSELPDQKVQSIINDFNKEQFLQARFKDYVDIQNAWMYFDYDKLRTKLTDELYNQYEMQLDTLKVKNQQNVMEKITYHDAMITNVTEENNQITVVLEMKVSFHDYIVQDKQVVRGNKHQKIYMHYELTFVSNKQAPSTCPNCGAQLTDKASQKCPYCNSTISNVSKDWVLSKKEAKYQR